LWIFYHSKIQKLTFSQKILITGSNGQVGSELRFIAQQFPQFDCHFVSKNELDIIDNHSIIQLFKNNKYFACINCAAYTAVDKAESDAENADKINHLAAANLAAACAKNGTLLLHISTDYVYHNGLTRPLIETDPTAPKGVYAATKLQGDRAVLAADTRFLVVRTAWVYSTFGTNFVKTMLRLGREKTALNIVNDQIGTPTYARHLAKALFFIIKKISENPTKNYGGIYHYSNEGSTNWASFAQAIHQKAAITTCEITPIPSINYPTPAARPLYSVLDKTKIKTVFGLKIAEWEEGLDMFFGSEDFSFCL
jgi:dTDP-4-dehydrorhamnose reductase